MRNAYAIYKKELSSYFNSPIAYIVVTAFLLISGWLFFNQFFLINQASMRPYFNLVPLFFVFFTPAITMRLIAEEKKSGTIELLLTLPVTAGQVVAGKFLAGLTVIASAIGMTLFYAVSVSLIGNLDLGPVAGGYLALLMMAAAYVAIGLMCSAWTRNQIIAFILAFAISFVLFILDKMLPFVPSFLASTVEYLSIDYHFQNIARGVIDSRDVVYYLSIITVCLLLSAHALESDQWK